MLVRVNVLIFVKESILILSLDLVKEINDKEENNIKIPKLNIISKQKILIKNFVNIPYKNLRF